MIYVDMDGVLADFDKHLHEMYGREYGKEVADDFWNRAVVADMPFALMPAISEGVSMLQTLRVLSPSILTSTGGGKNHIKIAHQKLMWLESHGFGDLPVAFCTGTKSKGSFAKPGGILIDDREKVCNAWRLGSGRAILFTRERAQEIAAHLLGTAQTGRAPE